MQDDKKTRARRWVNGYTGAGAAIVMAAVIPGSTSAALCTMEAHMCYKIGKIFLGDEYTFKEAVSAGRAIGLAAVAGKLLALELLNCVPGLGHLAKAVVAGGVIKTLGEAIIHYYDKKTSGHRAIVATQIVDDTPARNVRLDQVSGPVTTALVDAPAPLRSRTAEERLNEAVALFERQFITKDEFEALRRQILSGL